jgi:tRNA pseudouridine38-40 synthase
MKEEELNTNNSLHQSDLVRYKIILQYDGSEFSGFQKQKSSRTVQGEVESVINKLGWEGDSLLAAGRTDSGVHASGQVVAFDLEWKHSLKDLQSALNSYLPLDIAVQSVVRVRADFHPRYSAHGRKYHYKLFCEETRQPLKERYAWRVWPSVNLEIMEKAAMYLLGTHDFGAFGSPPKSGRSTLRTIMQAGWFKDASYLVFEIVGNAFLYHMVRHLVFILTCVGQERVKLETIEDMLEGKDVERLRGLAPANGLTLVEVLYPPEILMSDIK